MPDSVCENTVKTNEFGCVEKTTFTDKNSLTTTEGLLIKHVLFNASISLYGGHVLSWQPNHQQPVFWMSKDSLFGNQVGIRGGIPLCFPWFGGFVPDLFEHNKGIDFSGVEQALLANHGFARTTLWRLDNIEITETFVKVVLVQSDENQSPAWKIPYELRQELIFGTSFSQQLTVTNKSDEDIEYTGALHSYFAVGDPKSTYIDELSEIKYFDKLSGTHNNISQLKNCEGPIDRVYETNTPMKIVDKSWNRVIEVTSTDCKQWVLWNPGQETAANMNDVHLGGENEYVCLEAANTTPVGIKARTKMSFAQSIRILSL